MRPTPRAKLPIVGAGAAESRKRISAALGSASPPRRSSKPVTPAPRARSRQRRVAVRSREVCLSSQIATLSPLQASPASKAQSASLSVLAATATIAAGSRPKVTRPGAYSSPLSRRASASPIQSSEDALPVSTRRATSARAKPAAAAPSRLSAARISCRVASGRPPPRTESRAGMPSARRPSSPLRAFRTFSFAPASALAE
jgi:hypothetical protein